MSVIRKNCRQIINVPFAGRPLLNLKNGKFSTGCGESLG
jgi:hypothetical protein